MRKITVSILTIVICILLPVRICRARLITISITAEVTEVNDDADLFEDRIKVGDIVKGSYTYDIPGPNQVDNPYIGEYRFSDAQCGIKLQIGGFLIRSDPNDIELVIQTVNDMSTASLKLRDRFRLYSYRNLVYFNDEIFNDIIESCVLIHLEDSVSFDNSYHPLTASLTSALPACAPNLSEWSKRDLEITGRSLHGYFQIVGYLKSAVLITKPPKAIYVDAAAGINDGSSWEDAYISLQDALSDVNSMDKPVEIHVAQGFYRPDKGANVSLGDREATFNLINQVALKGGYAGLQESDPNTRNVRNYETILTGDLNGDDLFGFGNRFDNSYHVVSAIDVDESACLEGFVVTSGSADGWPTNPNPVSGISPDSSDRRSDHTICGGGLYINGSRPIVANCTFRDNFAYEYGGGLYINKSYPRILRSNFIGNVARYAGGVAACSDNDRLRSNALLEGCLLQGNSASLGGAIFQSDSTLWLTNCTLADNRVYNGRAEWSSYRYLKYFNCIHRDTEPQPLISDSIFYSNVLELEDIELKNGNINEDPLFVAPGYWVYPGNPDIVADPNDPNAVWIEGDYHLKSQAGRWDPSGQRWVCDDVTSPCIDTGDPGGLIDNEPFPNGGRINMGAYGGTAEASKSF